MQIKAHDLPFVAHSSKVTLWDSLIKTCWVKGALYVLWRQRLCTKYPYRAILQMRMLALPTANGSGRPILTAFKQPCLVTVCWTERPVSGSHITLAYTLFVYSQENHCFFTWLSMNRSCSHTKSASPSSRPSPMQVTSPDFLLQPLVKQVKWSHTFNHAVY